MKTTIKVLGALVLGLGMLSAYARTGTGRTTTPDAARSAVQSHGNAVRSSKSLKEADRAFLLRQNAIMEAYSNFSQTSVAGQTNVALMTHGLDAVTWGAAAALNYQKAINSITKTLQDKANPDSDAVKISEAHDLALSNGVVRAGMADPRDLSEIQEAKETVRENCRLIEHSS